MITKASIQNFKGISSCDITDLARINLLIGKNGSGKSTIMEALYLLNQSLSQGIQLVELLNRRTNVFSSARELWYHYNLKSPITISTNITGLTLQLRVNYNTETNQTSTFFGYVDPSTKNIKQIWNSATSGVDFQLNISYGAIDVLPLSKVSRAHLRHFAQNVEFIDCTAKSKTNVIERLWLWG